MLLLAQAQYILGASVGDELSGILSHLAVYLIIWSLFQTLPFQKSTFIFSVFGVSTDDAQ